MADSRRLLAPAPPGIAASTDSQRRKNVGTACKACKARKLKCTGMVPCANCHKSRLECTLDTTADRRRRGALKRKIDELEDKEDLLVRLVGVLRESGNRRAYPLVNLIRSNASLPEIRYYIDHQLSRDEAARTPEILEIGHVVDSRDDARSLRRILDTKRLSDTPRFRVPARPWTRVVEDDDLVSHLVSLWFTWCQPFGGCWVDRGRFLRDMQTGNAAGRRFCSPFLVNIILADACAYSDYPEAYAIPGDVASKGAHFFDEAKRLLEREEGRITLPTVQGLGVLWTCASLTRRDRQGWIYRSQLAYSLRELVQDNPPVAGSTDPDQSLMAQAVYSIRWGIFNIATIHALAEKKVPAIKSPQGAACAPPPPCDHTADPEEDWQPYPAQTDDSPTPSHTACVLSALSSLSPIVYDATRFLYGGEETTPRHEWSSLDERLRQWAADRLQGCLARGNMELPHVLCLHLTPNPNPNFNPSPTPTSLASARSIADLIRTHRGAWGLDRMPASNIQWMTAALFTLFPRLDEPFNRDAFIGLCVAAKAFSRRWEATRTTLGAVQAVAREKGVVLPVETDPLFQELDKLAGVTLRDEVECLFIPY
ncbi:C6 transcription factor [Aspergillus campestris IBT 28561]|uniref:C6 transcription factor n=1 Tax=Aspergillus campestris (strain IBT 28561) TaxID=1392248 RepID=A0A2I1CTX4_ASPC2|nr:C6 transcription factor [Aspergillus campestris IBT 28561]PKY01065.1 C6 transcription factor [Aspergillus campestris IBT 28561]